MSAIDRNIVIMGVALILLCGCATPQKTAYQSPNAALHKVISKYSISAESGIVCQSSLRTNLNCAMLAADLRMLSSQYPTHLDIGFFSAMVEYQMGRREQAQFVLDLLFSETQIPEVPVFLLRAKIAMEEGNPTLARKLLNTGLRAHPEHPEMYSHLAATYYLEGRYERSDEVLVIADRLGLPPWKTNFLMGVLHKEKHQISSACHYFSNTLRLKPGHKMALGHLIDLSRFEQCTNATIFQ